MLPSSGQSGRPGSGSFVTAYRNGGALSCQAMGRPREHGEETRERLLDAATRLLPDVGPAGLSVRLIADEVGTSTRAIYSVFGSKDGLLSARYRRGADTFARLAGAVPVSEDPLDELVPLGMSYRESALE